MAMGLIRIWWVCINEWTRFLLCVWRCWCVFVQPTCPAHAMSSSLWQREKPLSQPRYTTSPPTSLPASFNVIRISQYGKKSWTCVSLHSRLWVCSPSMSGTQKKWLAYRLEIWVWTLNDVYDPCNTCEYWHELVKFPSAMYRRRGLESCPRRMQQRDCGQDQQPLHRSSRFDS